MGSKLMQKNTIRPLEIMQLVDEKEKGRYYKIWKVLRRCLLFVDIEVERIQVRKPKVRLGLVEIWLLFRIWVHKLLPNY